MGGEYKQLCKGYLVVRRKQSFYGEASALSLGTPDPHERAGAQ